MKKIFLTGATGLLGEQVFKYILTKTDYSIVLLIRGKTLLHSQERFVRVLRKIAPQYLKKTSFSKRVEVLAGDQTLPFLGLDKNKYKELYNTVSEIYHCAALAEFRQPLERVRFVNVHGTRNILDFAKACVILNKVNYVSTAFIAGNYDGFFWEKNCEVNQSFNNTYEQSKYEAELLVNDYIRKGLRIAIYRPSIVVGEYKTGITNNFRMFYQPFRTISRGLIKEIPIHKKTILNIIPCDVAAEAIFSISINSNKNEVYHIISVEGMPIMHLMRLGSNFFGYKEPKYVKLEQFDKKKLTPLQKRLIEPYIPYFTLKVKFMADNAQKILKESGFKYPKINDEYVNRIFNYSYKMGYIKKYNSI